MDHTLDLRTITIGIPIGADRAEVERVQSTIASKMRPRTFRINLPPIDLSNYEKALGDCAEVEDLCSDLGIRWFNSPFDLTKCPDRISDFVLTLMREYQRSFVNFIVAKKGQISFEGIHQACALAKKISQMGEQGFHNFRVGISCNPVANTPFFPFSYSTPEMGFSVALELPQYIAQVIHENQSASVSQIQEAILSALGPHVRATDETCRGLAQTLGVAYHGIDLSIAPFPSDEHSMAGLIEAMGVEAFGAHGTLFFTSFFTDILKELRRRTKIKSTGFNGVMYSLLEDTKLSLANDRKMLTLDSLISFSSVCGCGLDMVPVPGDVFREELASIVLDVAGLSTTLTKPLGVRVLPIPGMSSGEMTTFNMDFLSNSRVMSVRNRVTWNQPMKSEAFSYKHKSPMIDENLVQEFWNKKSESSYAEVAIDELKPMWYVSQTQETPLMKEKLSIERELLLGSLHLRPEMKVLDLGCGNGYWSFQIASQVKQVTGVDYSPHAIAQAKAIAANHGIANAEFLEARAQDFRSDEHYDLIIVSGILIYINDSDYTQLMNNLSSFAAPDAQLVLREGTGIDGRHTLENVYSEAMDAQYSAIYRSANEYIQGLESVGFKLNHQSNFFPEGHPLNRYPETRLRLYLFKNNGASKLSTV